MEIGKSQRLLLKVAKIQRIFMRFLVNENLIKLFKY